MDSQLLLTGVGSHRGSSRLFLDTFLDANGTALGSHTPDENPAGGGWTVHSGSWDIQANGLRCVTATATPNGDAVSAALSTADFTATFVIDTNDARGAAVRVADTDNLWLARLNSTTLQLFERNGGAYTLRASSAATGAAPYTLTVVCAGASITLTRGGDSCNYASATFNQSTARVGYVATANNETFDTLEVTP